MDTGENKQDNNNQRIGLSIAKGVGLFLAGALITALIIVKVMPGMMLVTYESKYGFEETVSSVQENMEEVGWSSPGTININKSLKKHDQNLEPSVRMIQLCHPKYARQILQKNRHMASMMPCVIAVYEDDNGDVRLAKMNTGLMGKLFGGQIKRIMGQKVAADEHEILKNIVKGN